MKTPPMLVAAALLLWGWQTGFVVFAAMMAVVLESSRLMKVRWEFSQQEYQRIWDLCAVLFIGAVVIALSSEEIRIPLFAFVQWLPFIFFPMAAVQCFGSREEIALRTFAWLLRRRQSEWADKTINFSFIYFGICILSASAVSAGSALGQKYFYFAMAPLLMFALSAVRPGRFSRAAWISLAAFVFVSGYFAQRGLHELQSVVEAAVGRWLTSLGRGETDLRESRTAIGQIGKVKLSGKIVLRLEKESGAPPALLREASYDSFRHHVWSATVRDFTDADGDTNDLWKLLPAKEVNRSVRIAGYLDKGMGLLALPIGTAELRHLPVMTVSTNGLGVTRVTEGPGLVNFSARFGDGETADAPPQDFDEFVPENEHPAIAAIAELLGLKSVNSVDEKLRAIARFFESEFSYSTWITAKHIDRTRSRTPLAMFLTETRTGHCEYFATAAVLLAREAGIPARYATGFAVQESPKPGKYIVRQRHAHAWALIFHEGIWHDFDVTPASWSEVEEQHASFWQPVSDFWSRVKFEFAKWRYSETNYRQYLVWLLAPLLLILVWRILAARRRRVSSNSEANGKGPLWPGMDSEFYLIEQKLTELGFAREPAETLSQWQRRIDASARFSTKEIQPILQLHQRYRFDPEGIDANERRALSEKTNRWLTETEELLKAKISSEQNAPERGE